MVQPFSKVDRVDNIVLVQPFSKVDKVDNIVLVQPFSKVDKVDKVDRVVLFQPFSKVDKVDNKELKDKMIFTLYHMSPVRTHTYYMTYKEYKKWSKNNIIKSTDSYPTRTHIHFTS